MENMSQLGGNAMGYASGVMVGQNLGAGRPDRARESVQWGLVYIIGLQAMLGATLALFAPWVVRIFTSEPEVVTLGSVWLRFQVIAALFMCMSIVFQQSFNTAGDTLKPLLVTTFAVWAIEIPLAWLLVTQTSAGPLGVAGAAVVSMITRLALYVPLFLRSGWLKVRVLG
jgi:Na+-driven multidrug efflux pump